MVKTMKLVYRDELGLIAVEVDADYSISFCDGKAYFDGMDGKSYSIPVDSLQIICAE